jgi:pyruvate/2-oxoglutarate dehydrogenase complex dihydrolipoamide dehydrogenase (E3) component
VIFSGASAVCRGWRRAARFDEAQMPLRRSRRGRKAELRIAAATAMRPDREKAVIAGIPGSLADLMNRRGVEVVRGRGRFAGPNAVGADGEILEASHL